jgi:lipopolysaccharide heptosyltransferase II
MTHKAKNLRNISLERIGLILPTSLGGVIQAMPLLPVFKERFSLAKVTVIVSSEQADLFDNHSMISQSIVYNRRALFHEWRGLIRSLRKQQFDAVFDLHGLLRTGVMSLITKAPIRVGMETAREGAHLAYTHIMPDSGPLVPEYQRPWRIAEALGRGDLRRSSAIELDLPSQDWANAQLQRLNSVVLAVAPGAGWTTKRWPVEKFAVAACKAMRQYGCSVVVLGSEQERQLGTQFTDLMKKFIPSRPVLNLAGKTNLMQLAALLSKVDCLLTNDSGPMHMAASFGTPVVAVFTCTSSAISGPPGSQHELVSSCVGCYGSYKKKCPKRGPRHMACMDELTPQEVCDPLFRVISRRIRYRRVA